MISFVWSSKHPFHAGTGGSENYTIGQMRELQRRGIDCRIFSIGFGVEKSREKFPDITFEKIDSVQELEQLDDTIVFVTYPLVVKTKKPSYVIMHCPLSECSDEAPFDPRGGEDKTIMAPSKYSAALWADFFKRKASEVTAVYPFADKAFGAVKRAAHKSEKVRVLFASRLTPDKGIYTFLSALHFSKLSRDKFSFTVTTSGTHVETGRVILDMIKANPYINVIPAVKNAVDMAKMFAKFDIVVMPSTAQFWHEAFGMVSVEAQHAGCRVVASNSGGLPETDCGALTVVEADNPVALANGIVEAAALPPLTEEQRQAAAKKFTVEESVDTLLRVLKWNRV